MEKANCAVAGVIALFAVTGAAQAAEISGSYKGIIWSNFNLPGTTVFTTSANGKISARYTYDDNESGRLTNCKLLKRSLTCKWTDAYGSGKFTARFSQNFSSFTGAWYDPSGNGPYLWSGRK